MFCNEQSGLWVLVALFVLAFWGWTRSQNDKRKARLAFVERLERIAWIGLNAETYLRTPNVDGLYPTGNPIDVMRSSLRELHGFVYYDVHKLKFGRSPDSWEVRSAADRSKMALWADD